MKYTIEASNYGVKWKHICSFYDGDDSRFGPPMDYNIALLEVNSFKESIRGKEWKHIRLIVDIKDCPRHFEDKD